MPDIFVNIFTVLTLLGVGQAAFLIMLLLSFKQRDILPNILLAFLLFDFSIGLLGTTLGTSGYYERWPHLIRIGEPVVFMYGPLLYLYVRALVGKKWRTTDYLHFLPFVITVALLIPFFLKTGAEKIAFVDQYFKQQTLVAEAFGMVSIRQVHLLVYIFLSFTLLRQYERSLRDRFANVERLSLSWLNKLLWGFAIIVGVTIVTYALLLTGKISLLDSNIIASVMAAIVIYAIGFLGFRQARERLRWELQGQELPKVAPVEAPKVLPFPDAAAAQHLQQLEQLMEEEKVFTESDLSLNTLAQYLDIQPYQLSQLLNRSLQQSFFDYINHYRIEEVKRQLRDPQSQRFTILSVALDAGFNSKSSFNETFKKYTGMTPSAYRRSL